MSYHFRSCQIRIPRCRLPQGAGQISHRTQLEQFDNIAPPPWGSSHFRSCPTTSGHVKFEFPVVDYPKGLVKSVIGLNWNNLTILLLPLGAPPTSGHVLPLPVMSNSNSPLSITPRGWSNQS